MELRHLRYFVAVAEELHFGRAAARLHIAQPPLSQQIKAFEGELGIELFHRTKRRVELTDAGRQFLPEARATLAQARRAEEAAREAGEGRRGRLAVGFVTSACYTVLPAAVRDFRALYPGVDVTLQELIPAAQLAALERSDIDVGLLRPPVAAPGIRAETILSEPLVVALPQEHPLARRPSVPLRALRDEPFVLFPRRHGPGLYDAILPACQAAGFTPVVAHEPNEMQALLAHVAAGLGVSIVPASLSGFHAGDIAYRPLRGARLCIELAVIRSGQRPSAVAGNFCAVARAAARACAGRVSRRIQSAAGRDRRRPRLRTDTPGE